MHEVINVNVDYHNVQFAVDYCQIFLIDMHIYKVESVNFA
jgi:hypothetical protein